MSEHGRQPTSVVFPKVYATLDITQTPHQLQQSEENVDTERLMRPLKEMLFQLRGWTSTWNRNKGSSTGSNDTTPGACIQHAAAGHRVRSSNHSAVTSLSWWPFDKWGACNQQLREEAGVIAGFLTLVEESVCWLILEDRYPQPCVGVGQTDWKIRPAESAAKRL